MLSREEIALRISNLPATLRDAAATHALRVYGAPKDGGREVRRNAMRKRMAAVRAMSDRELFRRGEFPRETIDAEIPLDAPDQDVMLRLLGMDAVSGPIPAEAQLDEDVVVVPIADGGVRAVLMHREGAIEYVRAERERIMRATPDVQAAEWERCRRDRLWFMARWVDLESKFPVRGEKTIPFLPFPYQVRIVRLYDRARAERRGIFEDKSRQLGLSWLWMELFLHGLLFEEQASFFATSRKQDEVDDGGAGSTTRSLFGRVRFMFDQLPEFIAHGAGGADPVLRFKHLLISNEIGGSYLVGEAATVSIGRGGSYTAGLLDEFAHVERSEAAWASADEAIECAIVSSTPQGEDNKFADLHARLARPGSDADREIRRRFLVNRSHWSEHPIYARGIEHRTNDDGQTVLTSAWYRRACATKTTEKAAQEYDIEYAGSLPGRYIPEFSRALHVAEEPIRKHTGYWFYLSADHGLSDTEVWGLWQTDGRTFAELLSEWHTVPEGEHHGEDLTSAEVAESVIDWLRGWGLTFAQIEAIIVDPAGGAREQTSGQSHHDLLILTWERNGWRLRPEQWVPANNAFAGGIESTRMLLKGSWQDRTFTVRVSPDCTLTIDSLVNYRRRITREGKVLDQELHDWTNHAADMVRYFCHTLFPAIGDEAAADREGEPYAAAGARL